MPIKIPSLDPNGCQSRGELLVSQCDQRIDACQSKTATYKDRKRLLCGGDAPDEVFLLGLGFGADGEGVKQIEAESKIEGFVLAVAKVALAENLHADDAFACGAHFAHDADYSIWIGIHESAHRVDANEMNLDPGRFCGGAKRFDAVAGAAMSA